MKKILITGDFDSRDSSLVNGAKPVKVDVLFIEGTYGGRNHPDKEEEIARFIGMVVEVVERGGTVLIPSFANGRGQDVLMILHQALPHLNVHYDGMGKQITKHYLENSDCLRNPDALGTAFKWAKKVSSKSDKKKALSADVIVTTSGMLDGGPAIWYLNRLRDEPNSAIFFTGYQAKGSGGRSLQENGRVSIFGKMTEIDLLWQTFDFSTHAGHDELVEFTKACDAEDVVVYHSDPKNARLPLVKSLEVMGQRVHQPKNGESHIIE